MYVSIPILILDCYELESRRTLLHIPAFVSKPKHPTDSWNRNEQLGDELRHVPHQLIRLTTSPEESEKLVQEISSARQNKELKGGPWSPQRWPQIQGIRIMQPPTLEDQTAELPKGFTYYFSREAFSAKLKRFVPKTEGAEGN